MSGGTSLLFVIALAIGGVAVLYVIYHVTSLSHSVLDVRAKVRREMAAKEEQMQELIRSRLEQQAEWSRAERENALAALRAELTEEHAAFKRETAQTMERVVTEVATLKIQIDALAPPLQPESTVAHDRKGRPHGSA